MKKNRIFANSFSSNSRTLNTQRSTLKKALCMGVFLYTTLFSGFNAAAQTVELQGNSINPTDFIGSTNNEDLRFRTNNVERLTLKSLGTLGLGTNHPTGVCEIKSCLNLMNNAGPNVNPNSWFTVTKKENCEFGTLVGWDAPGEGDLGWDVLTLYNFGCGPFGLSWPFIGDYKHNFKTGHITSPTAPLYSNLKPLI